MAETGFDTPQTLAFSLRTDAASMELYLDRNRQAPLGDLVPETVLKLLAERNFAVDEAVQKKVAAAVAAWHEDAAAPAKVLLATGRPAVNGRNGKLVWAENCDPDRHAPGEDDTSFSHYASSLVTVKVGQVIATITPPTPGEPGVDVYGVELPARDGRPFVPVLRGGCHYDEAAGSIIADLAGPLKVRDGAISVSDSLHIEGNVDFNTGHVNAPGDVVIGGTVVDLFNVRAVKNVFIGGDVQSAEVRADGDVVIGGSLVNHRKFACIAGGNAEIKLVDNSIAVVRGNLRLLRQASNSDLFALRAIEAENAQITSGLIAARGGMTVHTLGSASGSAMIVLVGLDWLFHAIADPLVAEAGKIDQQLEKRMPALNALRMNLKRLTPAQREQATELGCEAEMLQEQRDENLARVEAMREIGRQDSRPVLKVLAQVFNGVELRIANRVTKILKPMRGPLSFTLEQTEKHGLCIVARSPSGLVLPMKTGRLELPLQGVTLPPQEVIEAMNLANSSAAEG